MEIDPRPINRRMIVQSVRLQGLTIQQLGVRPAVEPTTTPTAPLEPTQAAVVAPKPPAPVEPVAAPPAPVEADPTPAPTVVDPAPAPVEAPSPVDVGAEFDWAVMTSDLGTHYVGDRFATTLSATFNGQRITDYELHAGLFPPDITLNSHTGLVIGQLSQVGTFVFTIRARSQDDVSDASYSVTVNAARSH